MTSYRNHHAYSWGYIDSAIVCALCQFSSSAKTGNLQTNAAYSLNPAYTHVTGDVCKL